MRSRSAALAGLLPAVAAVVVALTPRAARAGDEAPTAKGDEPELGTLRPLGYVEAFYAYNFNRPANGVTAFRGFDDRHNSFTLSNAVLGADWTKGGANARVVLQFGRTPSSYYAAEPALAATGGTGSSDASVWRFLQEANGSYTFSRFTFSAGLFLSPFGWESLAVHDAWNWSRSTLFYALPFYHTGARVQYDLGHAFTYTFAVYNGWNSVIDNNDEKSVTEALGYDGGRVRGQVLYFGGVERNPGALEGRPWRHAFDASAIVDATARVSFAVHGSAGFEPTTFGRSSWVGGALYGRGELWKKKLYVAIRGDVMHEHRASNGLGAADPIFFPAATVASDTATLELVPVEHVSFRIEARHDQASADIYFRRNLIGDGTADRPWVANAKSQFTLTLGATAWF